MVLTFIMVLALVIVLMDFGKITLLGNVKLAYSLANFV